MSEISTPRKRDIKKGQELKPAKREPKILDLGDRYPRVSSAFLSHGEKDSNKNIVSNKVKTTAAINDQISEHLSAAADARNKYLSPTFLDFHDLPNCLPHFDETSHAAITAEKLLGEDKDWLWLKLTPFI